MKDTLSAIHSLMHTINRPVRLMEVCGTHTVAIFRHGIRGLLPDGITLLSGPGCPVCVTSAGDIDAVIALAEKPDVIVTTFGDMMRVPGKTRSLSGARADGADIRIVYSPLDALKLAAENPSRMVVFFGTGFETTSPSVAATVGEAVRNGVENFLVYSVHKLVPPAMAALLSSGEVQVDGFILPGHVSAIIGSAPYEFLARDFGKASVITGFEAHDILEGIRMILAQIASGKPAVKIGYTRVVRPEGNPKAVAVLNEYFEPEEAWWRGIGPIPGSGLKLRAKYEKFDASARLGLAPVRFEEPSACRCGDVLRGMKIPGECPLFGKSCTPEHPVGPCMVSSEGSCAAYFKYSV